MMPPRAVSHISMMPQHTAQQMHGWGPHSASQDAARHTQGSMQPADVDFHEIEGAEDAWVSDSQAAHARGHELRQDRQEGPYEEGELYQQTHGRQAPAHVQQPSWGAEVSHTSALGTAAFQRRRMDGPAVADWNQEHGLGYPSDAPPDPGTNQQRALWQQQPARHIYQVSATGQPYTQYSTPSQLQAGRRQQAGAPVMHAIAMRGTQYTAAAAGRATGPYHEHPPGQLPAPRVLLQSTRHQACNLI